MKIWFAGILKNTCNGLNKNKTNKNRGVVSLMSVNTTARIDIKYHISVFYCKHTNNQFFISGNSTSQVIYFSVFWLDHYFFSWGLMDSSFWARPPKIVHGFFLPLYHIFGCVLEEAHVRNNLEVGSGVLNGQRKLLN